jgi:CRP/FNR family transcriptional regulator
MATQHAVHSFAAPKVQWLSVRNLIETLLNFSRKKVSRRDTIYTHGKKLESLYFVYAGTFKTESVSSDGRVCSAEIQMDGDWLGFDAIATGSHTCTATALDIGEVWCINYEALLDVCALDVMLLSQVVKAISRDLGRSRSQRLSNDSLCADRKVADFLVHWVLNLAEHGRRTDVFNVPLTRAEIGSFLGIRVETVSRSMNVLKNMGLIEFDVGSRRQFCIPEIDGLKNYVLSSADENTGLCRYKNPILKHHSN